MNIQTNNSGRITASFRDPSGYVYFENGRVFRRINERGKADFEEFVKSGLAETLVKRGFLVPFEITGQNADSITICPEYIPFVTYPYEWSFSQLRDAAAATLEICRISLDYGFCLKDASAFNLTLHNGRMCFIDHTSFVRYDEGAPWCAYKQFCKQFVSPLLLMKMVSPECLDLLKCNVDGIELDLASKLLPLRSRFSLFALLHIHLHSAADLKYSSADQKQVNVFMPKHRLRHLFDGLLYDIRRLKADKIKTLWQDYYDNTNYSDDSFEHKKQLVEDFCRRKTPNVLLDLGANSGVFSEIGCKYSKQVIAADYDAGAVEMLYLKCRGGKKRLIPVKLDLFNPTPSVGQFNSERSSFFSRCHADCFLGLALMHHLRVTGNWRIEDIVRLFSMTEQCALAEFVPLEDTQMQRLVRGRHEIYSDWTIDNVTSAFAKHFRKVTTTEIKGTSRIMIELDNKM